MGTNIDICAHKWVHNERMKKDNSRFYEASNLSFTNQVCKSYWTTICECLDRENHVFLLIDEGLTNSTCKHIGALRGAIPDNWTKIETHWQSRGYDNVSFIGEYGKFTKEKRIELVNHLLMDAYWKFHALISGRSLECERISLRPIKYIEDLDKVYKDCSLKKWLKIEWNDLDGINEFNVPNVGPRQAVWTQVRYMVKAIIACKFEVQKKVITSSYNSNYTYTTIEYGCKDADWIQKIADAMFGNGTYAAYKKRTESIHKGKETAAKLSGIRTYLSIPEVKAFKNAPDDYMTNNDIRKLLKTKEGKRQLLDIKRETVRNKMERYYRSEHMKRQRFSFNRARKFLGIDELSESEIIWGGYDMTNINTVKIGDRLIYKRWYPEQWVKEKYNIPVKVCSDYAYIGSYNKDYIDFGAKMYKSFCDAPDKRQWRKRFWQMCELAMRRKRGQELYEWYNNKQGYVLELDEEDHHIMNEFVVRLNRYEADEEARKKVEREQKEREQRERLERIEAYKKNGIEGVRDIWREHLGDIPSEVRYNCPELYYGGNVLLRFSKQAGIIETSKGIRMTFEECHRYWNVISKWHEGGKFKPVQMAGYTVESYEDDILTAGCHCIAYEEMKRMYDLMIEREKEVA